MDRSQQERLYEENADGLFRFCYRLTGNSTQAEDIAADTFVAFFRSAPRGLDPLAAKTYLFRTAVRKWSTMRRRSFLGSIISAVQRQSEDLDVQMDLDRAIDLLPPKQKVAFVLVKAEGLTHQEAAELLGLPIGTVQSQVRQATISIRSHLGHGYLTTHKPETRNARP